MREHLRTIVPKSVAPPSGWWLWTDQHRYLLSTEAWAHLVLDPSQHWYLPGYPLLAAPFVWLTPVQPFLIPDLACLLAACWAFAALAARLLPAMRWARLLGAAVFAGTAAVSPLLLDSWVIPWTTTPVVPLVFAALANALAFAGAPTPRRALLAALASAAILWFRASDAAALVLVAAPFMLLALLWHRPARPRLAAIVGAALLGGLLPLALLLAGPSRGERVDPRPLPPGIAGRRLRLAADPAALDDAGARPAPAVFGRAGARGGLPLVPARPRRHGRLPGGAGARNPPAARAGDRRRGAGKRDVPRLSRPASAGALALSQLPLLQVDPPGAGALCRAARPAPGPPHPRAGDARRRVLVLAVALPWRAGFEPTPQRGAARFDGPGKVILPRGMPEAGDAVLLAARGSWETIYQGHHMLDVRGHRWYANSDIKALPVPGGILLVSLRPFGHAPAVITFDPGVVPRRTRAPDLRPRACALRPALPVSGGDAVLPRGHRRAMTAR